MIILYKQLYVYPDPFVRAGCWLVGWLVGWNFTAYQPLQVI